MKVALVYDRVNKWGGAERILLALHKIFPDASLFTSVYDEEKAFWAKVFNIKASFLQKFPFLLSNHQYLAPLMPIVFENFDFGTYDLVISVTSESAKGVITGPKTRHICICLTPTRYLWSGYSEYFSNKLIRSIFMPIISYLRYWDIIASKRPDKIIAISKEVQNRIKIYYKRDSSLVYPPVEVRNNSKASVHPGKYFLVVSRLSKLTGYKRIDLAVKACTELNLPLVVVGDGDNSFLKEMSGPQVTFVGKVSDEALSDYYLNCKAVIFPSYEDFGLVPIEAQAHGKPVIAYARGGALETVIEGKTGVFFNSQTVEALVTALKRFDENDYNSNECYKNSEFFTFKRFEEGIRSEVYNS